MKQFAKFTQTQTMNQKRCKITLKVVLVANVFSSVSRKSIVYAGYLGQCVWHHFYWFGVKTITRYRFVADKFLDVACGLNCVRTKLGSESVRFLDLMGKGHYQSMIISGVSKHCQHTFHFRMSVILFSIPTQQEIREQKQLRQFDKNTRRLVKRTGYIHRDLTFVNQILAGTGLASILLFFFQQLCLRWMG